MKKNISLVLSTILVGSAFLVGCGSDDNTTSTAATSASVKVGGSYVIGIQPQGLGLIFGSDVCENNVDINTTSDAFTISTSQFSVQGDVNTTCNHSVTEDFNITVNTLRSYYVEALNSGVAPARFSNKVGIAPYKGVKGKEVNIFSTIAVDTNQTVEDIDVNSATSPAIKALKDTIQLKLSTGTLLSAIVSNKSDLNITAIKTNYVGKDVNLSSADVGTVVTNTGINLAVMNAMKTVYKNNTTATSATVFADGNVTAADTNGTISGLITDANTTANAPTLSVSGMGLKVGTYNYTGNSNNFVVNRLKADAVTTSDDVVLSVSAAGLNNFTLTGSTLKAVISKTNPTNTLTITLSGVSLSTNATTGNISATVASGSTLAVVSSYSGISSVSGILDSAATTTDLSFSVNNLISKITSNTSAVTSVKNEILTALGTAGEYKVTVGLSGITTERSNLTDVNATLGAGYKGYTGTVNIAASAAELAAIEAATASLATATTQATAATAAISSIATATTDAAVDAAADLAATAAAAAKTACDAVSNATLATASQKSTASSIKASVVAEEATVSDIVTARKTYIAANATLLAYEALANFAVNGTLSEASNTSGTYTLKAKTTTAAPASTSQNLSLYVAINGSTTPVAVPVINTYAAGTKFIIGVYTGSTLVGVSSEYTLTSTDITNSETSSNIAVTAQ